MRKQRLKVAHIVCTFPPYRGGMGKVAWGDAKILADFNYSVDVLTPKYNYLQHLPKYDQVDGVSVIRLPSFFQFGNAAIIPKLFWLLRKYDIYHLHYPFYGIGIFIMLAKIVWRKKLVIHYHMDNLANDWRRYIFQFYLYFLFPQLLKVADVIICHSLDYALNCRGSWWIKKWQYKLREVPNGVNINFYQPVSNDERFIVVTKQLLFVAALDRAHYFKGLEILINAVNKLISKNWHLNIVGNGDLINYYRTLVKTLNLDQKVTFFQNCDDEQLRRMYQSSYLTILPSISSAEAFGIVSIESLACATPVVTSNLPGVRSVVDDHVNGLLAKATDVEDLRSKIDYLIEHPKEAELLGKNGYHKIINMYSWQIIGQKLSKLYENMYH